MKVEILSVLLFGFVIHSVHGQLLDDPVKVHPRKILLDSIYNIKNGEDVNKIKGKKMSSKNFILLTENMPVDFQNTETTILGKRVIGKNNCVVFVKLIKDNDRIEFRCFLFHLEYASLMSIKYLASYNKISEQIAIVPQDNLVTVYTSYFKCENGKCSDRIYKTSTEIYKQEYGLNIQM